MGFGSRHGCRVPASNFGETWRRMVSSEQAHDRVLLRLRYFCGRGRKVRFRGGIRTIRAIARRGCRKSRSPSGVLRKQLERVALLYWLLGRSGRSFAKRGTLSSTFNGVNVLLLKVEHLAYLRQLHGRTQHGLADGTGNPKLSELALLFSVDVGLLAQYYFTSDRRPST